MQNTFLLIVSFILLLSYFAKAQNDPYDFLTLVIEKADGEIDQLIDYPEDSTHQVTAKKEN